MTEQLRFPELENPTAAPMVLMHEIVILVPDYKIAVAALPDYAVVRTSRAVYAPLPGWKKLPQAEVKKTAVDVAPPPDPPTPEKKPRFVGGFKNKGIARCELFLRVLKLNDPAIVEFATFIPHFVNREKPFAVKSISSAAKDLVEVGFVERVARRRWRLTDKGRTNTYVSPGDAKKSK